MIDRVEFARVMGAFADRLDRPLAPLTSEMYFDVLGERLTTDEFLAGARIVFRSHAWNTWPAPQAFIDAAQPKAAPLLDGATAFEHVLDIANRCRSSWADRQALITALGEPAARAFIATGGRRELDGITVDQVPFARRRFLEAFTAALDAVARRDDATAALQVVRGAPRGEIDARVTSLVRDVSIARALPQPGGAP